MEQEKQKQKIYCSECRYWNTVYGEQVCDAEDNKMYASPTYRTSFDYIRSPRFRNKTNSCESFKLKKTETIKRNIKEAVKTVFQRMFYGTKK